MFKNGIAQPVLLFLSLHHMFRIDAFTPALVAVKICWLILTTSFHGNHLRQIIYSFIHLLEHFPIVFRFPS